MILDAIDQAPDITLAELRELLAGRGVAVAPSTLWRVFARRRITRKRVRTPPSRTSRTS